MNTLKENMMVGFLVALAIGPSLTTTPNLSLAVRLSSISLLATGRVVSELKSQSTRHDFKQQIVHFEDATHPSRKDAA